MSNGNRSVEFFRTYIRVLGATVSYVEAARRLNLSEAWVYKCLSSSKAASAAPDVPSVFLFEAEEDDGEPRWFHDHVRSAVSNSIEAIEAAARSRALHGTFTAAKFQGKTVYKEDPTLLGVDDQLLDMLGLPDRLLRDERGRPVPEQVWTPPSTDLVLGILAAHSKRYRKQSSVDVNLSARLSGGVQVIGNKPAPSIAAPLPMLVEIVQEAIEEPERAATDEEPPADFTELDDIGVTDTPAEPDEPEPEAAPTPPAPVMIRAATPTEYAPPTQAGPLAPPRRALSPMERDLLTRLNGTPEQRSAPVIPSSLNRKS
jgi:hypothetical protein